MATTSGAPSHNAFSHFRAEDCVITKVDRNTYTVTAETITTNKTIEDIWCLMPYHHYTNGEGIFCLPEVGALATVAFPSDNSPPFILGFRPAAGVLNSSDDAPQRSTASAEGSPTDASFRSRRTDANPGDIVLMTRDENFVRLRRGGVLEIGATPIAQRIYIPVLNYIKDFAENYEMHTFGGDIQWTVGRQEEDPSGNAPVTYNFQINEFAQDAKASVRVQHYPQGSTGDKSAWMVHIAPQGIDRDDGSVENEKYSLIITMGGEKIEIIGSSRTVEVKGDDSLTISGSRSTEINGSDTLNADGNIEAISGQTHVIGGSVVKVGGPQASRQSVYGDALVQFLATAVYILDPSTGTSVMSPASAAGLQAILSSKVLIE